MPYYDRECNNCENVWESEESPDGKLLEPTGCQLQWRDARFAAEICPKCAARGAKRRISKTNFILRGPGWAKDGYTR